MSKIAQDVLSEALRKARADAKSLKEEHGETIRQGRRAQLIVDEAERVVRDLEAAFAKVSRP